MPLKHHADEKQRVWRRVFRQKYRERLRKAPGVLMHPKNDSNSDRICCLQSSGLCQTMGSKHHRSNKKCWSFPETCEHCSAIRAASAEKEISNASREPAILSPSDTVSPKDQLSLSDPGGISNEASIQWNNTVQVSILPAVVEDWIPETVVMGVANQAVAGISIRPQHKEQSIESIEQLQSPDFPQTTPVASPIGLIHGHDLIDLEQRMLRSQAPSPESCRGEVLRFRFSSTQVERTRDPRLDLDFVLEVA